jgi:hypothetical protein
MATGIAEVFPTDLAQEKKFDYDLITEGVQLTLVAMNIPLAQQSQLQIRANLMAALNGDPSGGGLVPEDGVALGILAISDDRPQWFDSELLRMPLRQNATPGDAQRDLHRQYQKLFDDVMTYRREGALTGDFAASDYFRLMPPAGSVSKESVNPVTGRQGFFPENYRVWITPIRRAEVALLQEESMLLPPLDMGLDDPQDIVVLAPLNNQDYGHYAQRLMRHGDGIGDRRVPRLDLLKLRLYPRRPIHEIDTDKGTWQAIWDLVAEQDLVYVRRPLRVAETGMSAIVLAQGIAVPPPTEPGDTDPSPGDDSVLEDEDAIFLRRIDLNSIMSLRPGHTEVSAEAQEKILERFGNQAVIVREIVLLLMRFEKQYDDLVWPTIAVVANNKMLQPLREQLVQMQDTGTSTPKSMLELGPGVGLGSEIMKAWEQAAQEGR